MSRCWVALLTAAGITACGGQPFEPPPRTPKVVAEEARVVALLEGRDDPAFGGRGDCAVRILGFEGDSTFAWRACTFRHDPEVESGVSGPIRVDGSTIRTPADGSGYDDSVRDMFPERLAEAVLEDRGQLSRDLSSSIGA